MDQSLVGRQAEQEALRACLRASRTGRTPVVLVAGEAGAGKTALVERVLADAGQPVLRGRAAEWTRAAYEVIAQALRPAVGSSYGRAAATRAPAEARVAATGRPPAGAAATAPAPGQPDTTAPAAELTVIMPELGTPPAQVSRSGLAAAVAAVLADAAAAGSVALFLDDMQWADEATLDLLPALADALSGQPVIVIGCYRSDELPRDHRLRTARAELRRHHRLTEITLAPLGDDDVRRMLADLLTASPEEGLAAAVAGRADGIPFAVEELAFALRDSGRLAYREGTVRLTGPGDTPIPDGVREAVLLRTTRLGQAERALIEAAAVAGDEFDIDAVLAAAGAVAKSAPGGAAGVPAWPDQLAASGLVTEVTDGRARFRHALTRDATYADIPWSRRRELHRALAGRLAGSGAPAALVAAHLVAARDTGKARDALLAAAAEHWAVHAYRDAGRALRTALEDWPSGWQETRRLDVLDRLARCAEMCADHADALTRLRELAEAYRRGGDRLGLAGAGRRLALAYELLGQWHAALAARETAATAFAAAGLPEEAAVDRLAAASHLRSAASFSAALDTLTAARADAGTAGRADLLLRVDGLRGNILARIGQPREGLAAIRGALDQALAQGMPGPAAELHQRLADALENSGDYGAAAAAYSTAYQFCATHGEDVTGQLCRACVTVVLFSCGHWDRAADVCAEVLGSAAAPPHARAVSAGILGLVHAMRGASGRALPQLLEAASIAARIELTPMELLSSWGLCVLDHAAGAADGAANRARLILARWGETQERHYCIPILQWASTFFAETGAAAQTRACAAALSRIAEETAQPEALAALAHALAETALLDGEPKTAAQEFARAVELFGQLGLPLATAQAQRRAGAVLAGLGERERAAGLLHAAHDTAQHLGAEPLRMTCAGALTALGERPRRGRGARQALPGGLSRREAEVMRLVARGNTSREIGACLFLSHRTVEMYVRSGMRKLQCRTRAEAVRRLAELGVLEPRQP